ncbi:hypothetical protein GCM10023194_07880 [Planotetraspora phitsanulokensis]|uniref:Uncharacterized protein n=1 Tax=Planotetraspora phitsanulokensis TaxID=575192 RepID=A0A8J3XHJ3_9ACTN|nr:hypothetical protein Pph01_50290 [Planotetraspora phitsanulokensis]
MGEGRYGQADGEGQGSGGDGAGTAERGVERHGNLHFWVTGKDDDPFTGTATAREPYRKRP